MNCDTASRFVRAHLYGAVVIGTFLVLLPAAVKPADSLIGGSMPSWARLAGALILPAGAMLSYASFWLFITRGRGTAFPTDPPRALVIAGPYRRVRNPMYVGNLTMLFGEALILASPAILAYAVLLCAVTHLYITRVEEPALAERYGEPYLSYMASTPRWVPRIGRSVPRQATVS